MQGGVVVAAMKIEYDPFKRVGRHSGELKPEEFIDTDKDVWPRPLFRSVIVGKLTVLGKRVYNGPITHFH